MQTIKGVTYKKVEGIGCDGCVARNDDHLCGKLTGCKTGEGFVIVDGEPNIPQHEPGAKLDEGKPMTGLVYEGFARALSKVAEVGTFGAKKYTPNGWLEVPDGVRRYTDAMFRHFNKEAMGEEMDDESELNHAAHLAWNALAVLELKLRAKDAEGDFCAVCDHHHCICK